MKHLLSLFVACAFFAQPVFSAETKKVCVDQKQKDGKTKQVCKDVKVHKKLEGTKVPDQKK